MLLTICTPTYNRARMLSRVYASLCRQDNTNFEWLVVDDGSTDNTADIIKKFEIGYIKKENGGKHTAVNEGVKAAKGDIFLILDSDDFLTDNAVTIIMEAFSNLPHKKFAGCGFNKLFQDWSLVGKSFKGNYVDSTSLERQKYGIQGDKAEVFFTEILRKYPFPIFKKEKFLTEAIVWNRIANDGYQIRWINQGIYLCEYQPDGLSFTSTTDRGFQGYTLFIKELLSYDSIAPKEKIRWAGVYAYIAHRKRYTYKKIAKLVNTNVLFILFSEHLYKIVKFKRGKNARKQQLRNERNADEKQ